MRSLILGIALVAACASAVSLEGPALRTTPTQDTVHVPSSCGNGKPNTIPVVTDDPTFVKNIGSHGKLFTAGQANDTFAVLHLYGTPYDQGFANGQANSAAISNVWANFLVYIDNMAKKPLSKDKIKLPSWLYDLFNTYGVPAILDWTWSNTEAFTPQRYKDEMQGMADGAGVDVKLVRHINMFPEVIRAACTIVGATKTATPNGKIAHLRALDFGPHMPIRDYPQVTVYHSETQPTVANVGWAGLIGSLTGISDTTISIGEKVWYPPGKSRSIIFNNVSGWKGEPWMFILRDVLLTKNISDALSTIQKANKTCSIHVGVGDSTTNTFRGVTMAKKAFNVYDSHTLNYPGHPELDHVTYWNKFLQPSHNACLGDLLKQNYGKLDAKMLALNIAPISTTGEMHTVAFDLGGQMAYIANARQSIANGTGHLDSYARQYTLVNLTKLWAVENTALPVSSGKQQDKAVGADDCSSFTTCDTCTAAGGGCGWCTVYGNSCLKGNKTCPSANPAFCTKQSWTWFSSQCPTKQI